MPALFLIIVLGAFLAWGFAVVSALQIVSMSPRGDKFGNYFRLGLWRFGELERRLGPDVRPLLIRYRRGFLAFFLCIAAALAASFISVAQQGS